MDHNTETDRETENGAGTEGTVSIEKLHEERRYWQERLKAETERHDEAIKQVKTASNNLIAVFCREYGIKNPDGTYKVKIPIPESGWLTAGKREDDGYILEAKKVEL